MDNIEKSCIFVYNINQYNKIMNNSTITHTWDNAKTVYENIHSLLVTQNDELQPIEFDTALNWLGQSNHGLNFPEFEDAVSMLCHIYKSFSHGTYLWQPGLNDYENLCDLICYCASDNLIKNVSFAVYICPWLDSDYVKSLISKNFELDEWTCLDAEIIEMQADHD